MRVSESSAASWDSLQKKAHKDLEKHAFEELFELCLPKQNILKSEPMFNSTQILHQTTVGVAFLMQTCGMFYFKFISITVGHGEIEVQL